MRGHASIQGSTDIPTLYDLLPGYLPMPRATEEDLTLDDYCERGGSDRGWWSHFDKYIVSLLKAWFGDAATRGERLRLPAAAEDHGQPLALPDDAARARRRPGRLLRDGPEPGRGLASTRACSAARWRSLKWLVVRDLAELETASFWRDSPEVRSGELRTEDIETEVFLMPAAAHVEKEGHFTNTQRLLQWRDKALEPPGDARSELWFMHHLAKRVMAHYADSEDAQGLAAAQPELGLPRARRARRARRRGGAARDQRLRRREPASRCRRLRRAGRPTAPPPAAAGSTPAASPTA